MVDMDDMDDMWNHESKSLPPPHADAATLV